MKIQNYEQFLNEQALNTVTNTPLESVIDTKGRILASLPSLKDKDTDFMTCPRYEFVLPNVKTVREFQDTTYTNGFWNAIYDYNRLVDTNDYTAIDSNMKKFGNKLVGKRLYVYCYDKADIDELKSRCENAKTTCNFVSVRFIER